MNLPVGVAVAILTGVAVLLVMAGEAVLSRVNERFMRNRGAAEADGDVYRAMQWAYPGAFMAMVIEGAITGPAPRDVLFSGLAVFGFAKALKAWAISTLGPRWTFKVLVLKDAPLITGGPYRFINHPNYVAVIAELVGVAMIVGAPFTGVLAVAGFGSLILKRIRIEDRALGRSDG